MFLVIACLHAASASPQISPLPDRDLAVGYGRAVLTLPDLDGDGVSEFAAGAPGLPVGEVLRAGRVLIHSGATREIISEWTSEFDRGFGFSLGALSDADGDDFPDVLVGYSAGQGASRTDVRSGRTGRLISTFEDADESVVPIGDADEDGIPDLLLTAREPWRLVRGSDGALLGHEVSARRSSWPTGFYSVAPGELWPVGDLNGDGLVDGVLASHPPQLFLSHRRASENGEVSIYPVNQRRPLSRVIEEFMPGMDAVVWSAAPAGDLDADGAPDFYLGTVEPGGSSTLVGVSGIEFASRSAAPRILTARPALDGPILEEYLHFAQDLMVLGDIDGKPGDESVCMGHPESPYKRLYALTPSGDAPVWTHEVKGFQYYRSEATLALFDDVDGDGAPEVLAGMASSYGRHDSFGSGVIELVSGRTGNVIWDSRHFPITDTERFLAETRDARPLLLVQGLRDSARQLELLRAAPMAEEIPDLLILHMDEFLSAPMDDPIRCLPGAEAFRLAYLMGPPTDGFEMVLVGASGAKIKRYGLVTDPATIIADHRAAARARWERECRYEEAAGERGPVILIQESAQTQRQVDLLNRARTALLKVDAAVIDLGARPPACVLGTRDSLPDAAYLRKHYELGAGPYEFDMTVVAPDGRWLGRFQRPVSAEDVLSCIRYAR